MMKYFKSSIWFTVFALLVGAFFGYSTSHTIDGALKALFLCSVLALLETSLSFDNAVVNASVLKEMTPLWQRRFLTWGIWIAVFGMRVIFPLLIVSIAAQVNPFTALEMALVDPDRYSQIMLSAHIPVVAFGGAFLLMVALKYFFDDQKKVHWIRLIEAPLTRLGRMEAIEAAFALSVLYFFSKKVPDHEQTLFLTSGIMGIVTFVIVDGLEIFLETGAEHVESGGLRTPAQMAKTSASLFIYLEVLDASFSFDGVVGAFAISNNLFIIASGLAIGAMFVRSLTIMLVEKNTLTELKYLEHGAFYAIFALAMIMFFESYMQVNELLSGIIGVFFIAVSAIASLPKFQRKK